MNLFKRFKNDSAAKIANAMLREPIAPPLHDEVRRALVDLAKHPDCDSATDLCGWASGERLIDCLQVASRSAAYSDWVDSAEILAS